MLEYGDSEPFWSDFVGTGSTIDDYQNGEDPPKSTRDLQMDYAWKSGASFGPACVQMKAENQYALEPVDCSGEAKFLCIKTLCPSGFLMYDMKTCAKVMTNTASKDDAIAACQALNPGAKMLAPKTKYEQFVMENFLQKAGLTTEVYLAAKKQDSGHWFWDDGTPIFVSPLDWLTKPTAVMGSVSSGTENIVNGILYDDGFRTDTNNQKKWIEITLPESILIPSVTFHTTVSADSYAKHLDVRVGTETTPDTAGSTDANTRCEYKSNPMPDHDKVKFVCPSPGLEGNIITIQKIHGEEMWGLEVQPYGKLFFLKMDIF